MVRIVPYLLLVVYMLSMVSMIVSQQQISKCIMNVNLLTENCISAWCQKGGEDIKLIKNDNYSLSATTASEHAPFTDYPPIFANTFSFELTKSGSCDAGSSIILNFENCCVSIERSFIYMHYLMMVKQQESVFFPKYFSTINNAISDKTSPVLHMTIYNEDDFLTDPAVTSSEIFKFELEQDTEAINIGLYQIYDNVAHRYVQLSMNGDGSSAQELISANGHMLKGKELHDVFGEYVFPVVPKIEDMKFTSNAGSDILTALGWTFKDNSVTVSQSDDKEHVLVSEFQYMHITKKVSGSKFSDVFFACLAFKNKADSIEHRDYALHIIVIGLNKDDEIISVTRFTSARTFFVMEEAKKINSVTFTHFTSITFQIPILSSTDKIVLLLDENRSTLSFYNPRIVAYQSKQVQFPAVAIAIIVILGTVLLAVLPVSYFKLRCQ